MASLSYLFFNSIFFHQRFKYKDIITCKAVAVSNATVGLTALLRFKNSKTRLILSIKTWSKKYTNSEYKNNEKQEPS